MVCLDNYHKFNLKEEKQSVDKVILPSLRFHLLLGTVSLTAFLLAQSPTFAATVDLSHEGPEKRFHTPYRSPPGFGSFQDFSHPGEQEEAVDVGRGIGLEPGHQPLSQYSQQLPLNNLMRSHSQVEERPFLARQNVKAIDLTGWVQVQKGDVEDAPVAVAFPTRRTKTSYIVPVVTSTVIKPTGRLLKSTAEGAYYALPHVARAGWWTVCKGFEALGSTLSVIDDAALYTVETVRDVREGRATVEEKGWEAGKRTKTAFKSAGNWTLQTATEAVENAASPLWNGLKWTAEEIWKNTTIAVKDMREAYLDDLGSAMWSSIKSTASRAKTYIENTASLTASKVKAAGSSAASWIMSQVKSASAFVSSKASSSKAWFTHKFSK